LRKRRTWSRSRAATSSSSKLGEEAIRRASEELAKAGAFDLADLGAQGAGTGHVAEEQRAFGP
jgi:hypothetical protein